MLANGSTAGPWITCPSEANREPWHEQSQVGGHGAHLAICGDVESCRMPTDIHDLCLFGVGWIGRREAVEMTADEIAGHFADIASKLTEPAKRVPRRVEDLGP